MSAITFDTLKFANRLKAAGVPSEQAEAQANAMVDAFQFSEIATKGDLGQLKIEMIQWMVGIMLAQTALLAAVIFALLRQAH